MNLHLTPALRRLNPATPLVLGLCCLLLSLAALPLSWRAALLASQLIFLALAGAARRYLPFAVAGLLPVAAMAFIIQTISRGGGEVYARWQPFHRVTFEISSEGIELGALLAVQIINFGSACALISLLTTPTGLRYALTSWHVPPRLTYLLVASLNAPQQLSHYIRIAKDAARARGVDDSTFLRRTWLNLRTAGTLLNLVLIDQEDRGRTLHQRGIELKGRRIFLTTFPDSAAQKALRLLLPVATLVGIYLTYWGGNSWLSSLL